MSEDRYYLISQVVEELRREFPDISVSKIRYFDNKGLLNLQRSQSGYRRFRQEDIDQLRWVLKQQSKNFLPLKVIRSRLASGEWKQDGSETASEEARSQTMAQSGLPTRSASSRRPEELTRAEFIQKSGLRESELRELQQHKLFSVKKTFDRHDIEVARLASELLPLGLEPRHLRTYALAAERQADLAERVTRTLLVGNDMQKRKNGVEQLHAIAGLGAEMQRVILARLLEETEAGN